MKLRADVLSVGKGVGQLEPPPCGTNALYMVSNSAVLPEPGATENLVYIWPPEDRSKELLNFFS